MGEYGAGNEFLRWYESDFEIHADFCRGKESVEVRLEVKTDRGEGPFTDFRYEIYCYSF